MQDEDALDTKTLMMLLLGQLRERVQTHPISTLAGAASLGYMLGWSMPSALFRVMGSMALRAATMHVVSDVLRPEGLGEVVDDLGDLEGESVTARSPMPGDPRVSDPYVA